MLPESISPLMKPTFLLSAVLVAGLSSCGDIAGSKSADAVPPKAATLEEQTVPPGAVAGRTDYSLAELIEMAKEGGNEFWAILEAWIPTASDEDVAQMYRHLPPSSGRVIFSNLMADQDPARTLDIARRLINGHDSAVVGSRAFRAMIKASPAAAVQAALKLPPGALRSSAFSVLFDSEGWRSQKAELIARAGDLFLGDQMKLGTALAASAADVGLLETDLINAPAPTKKAFVDELARCWVKEHHGSLEALTAQLPDELKAPATESYFMTLSGTDPQAALALATQLGRKEVDHAAATWAGMDPAAAAEFFAARPEFESGLSRVFNHWLGVAPLDASKYAATQLKGRAAELAAVEIAQDCLQHGDKTSADKWIQTISDPDLKKAASSR